MCASGRLVGGKHCVAALLQAQCRQCTAAVEHWQPASSEAVLGSNYRSVLGAVAGAPTFYQYRPSGGGARLAALMPCILVRQLTFSESEFHSSIPHPDCVWLQAFCSCIIAVYHPHCTTPCLQVDGLQLSGSRAMILVKSGQDVCNHTSFIGSKQGLPRFLC